LHGGESIVRVDQLQPGDIVVTWHQVSERDASLIYARVLKVHRVMVTVQDEWLNIVRVRPAVFTNKERGWFPPSLALCSSRVA
jgi:hypothetical protein